MLELGGCSGEPIQWQGMRGVGLILRNVKGGERSRCV